jgi:hypothetical protein
LKKILIAALAALTALAAAVAVASAQDATPTPGATVKSTLSPSKTGTKTKPKPEKLTLNIVNEDSSQTADGIKIWIAKQIKVNGKGLKYCSQSKLENGLSASSCPTASKLGVGNAVAYAGVNTGSPAKFTFNLTAFMLSAKKIGFLIHHSAPDIDALSVGTIKSASGQFGSLLDISIPQVAREFPAGTFNGLASIQTSLYKKIGKHTLYSSTGCNTSRSLPFKVQIHFQNNPNPPKAATVTAKTGANCHK